MNQTSVNATISINMKESAIMIHKNTLRALGKPEYIQILINPEEKTIVLCCSSESDYLAHHVKEEIFWDTRKSMKIHSCILLKNLYSIYPKWDIKGTYKLTGEYISSLNIVKFNMLNSSLSGQYKTGDLNE